RATRRSSRSRRRSSRFHSCVSGWSAVALSRSPPNPPTIKNKEMHHMTLQGKTALVTGGGRDIGRSVSIALARAGVRVAINYNSGREAAEETLRMIQDAGGDAFLVQADVTDSNAVRAMLEEVGIAFSGRLDILVNLAGGMVARKTLSEMDEEFFDHVMTLNLKSAFLVLQASQPFLGEGSAVVNVSSLAGRDGGGPGASVYATAKGALMTYTRSMAKEL